MENRTLEEIIIEKQKNARLDLQRNHFERTRFTLIGEIRAYEDILALIRANKFTSVKRGD